MKNLIIVVTGLFVLGCSSSLSLEEIKKMEYKCETEGKLNAFYVHLVFPENEKTKKVKINRIRDEKIVESFEVKHHESINRPFYAHDTYEFLVKGEEPFILTNMKTRLNPRCHHYGCKPICEIEYAKMNGKDFGPSDEGISLQKNGFKENWE